MTSLLRKTTKALTRKLVLVPVATLALAAGAGAPVMEMAGFGTAPGQQKRGFTISGAATTQLSPGSSAALDLSFGNPNQQPLQVDELLVAVVETSDAACGPDNFESIDNSGAYPITIPRGASRLSDLVTDSSRWPRVAMINTTANQDACKGVEGGLSYSGVASK